MNPAWIRSSCKSTRLIIGHQPHAIVEELRRVALRENVRVPLGPFHHEKHNCMFGFSWQLSAMIVSRPRLLGALRAALVRIALADLGLERVAVVYPGTRRYTLADRVEAVPLQSLAAPGQLFR